MHAGREILDALNLVTGQEEVAKLGDVEPSVGRALHTPEIEIEAVHVNPGLQARLALGKKQGPTLSSRPRALPPKRQGR